MRKFFCLPIGSLAVLAALPLIAVAQAASCMSVTMADSAAANTNVAATISVARCVSSPDPVTFQSFLNVNSSNASVASPVTSQIQLSTSGTAGVLIAAHPVTACTSVTITFSTKLANQTISATKTLLVCPFAFDIGVSGINVTPSAAGQESQVSVTITNQGSQILASNYGVTLSTQEDTSNLVRNTCSSQPPASVSGPVLPEIRPGAQQTVIFPFRFPQAGNLTLVAQASIGGSEDGPASNNSRTQAVTVPLPRPLICEITPLTTNPGDTVTISGNWFKKLGTADLPTISFGNVNAPIVNVASPLQMTVTMPDLSCTAAGRVSIAVVNATGTTTSQGGPTFPAAPNITGSSAAHSCPGGSMTINVAGLRGSCGDPIVRLGNQALQVTNTTADTIVVQLPRPFPLFSAPLTMQTTYGTDSISLSFLPPTITSTALNRPQYSPPGTSESLTINLAHFRPDCTFTVTLEPETTALGAPAAVGRPFSPPVLNTTDNSIVVRVFQANGIGVWTLKVQTPYGTATKTITLPGPSALPGPSIP